MEEKDRLLSDKMTTYLCNFAKNGEPNGQGNVAWSPCEENRTVMRFGEKSLHMGNPSIMRLIGIMLTNKAVGE
jgi:carboxylesterase type B